MALFRPGPKDSNRPLFNWAHWAVGMLAHVLSGMSFITVIKKAIIESSLATTLSGKLYTER